MAFGEAIKNKV